MSTSPSAVTTTTIHPSWWARAGTWFLKTAGTVKNTVLKVVGMSDKIAQEVQVIAPTVEAISNIVLPGSATFEQHLLDVWSHVAAAVHTAGDAAAANGVNLTIDAQLASEVKAIIPAVQQYLHPQAGPAPAPKS